MAFINDSDASHIIYGTAYADDINGNGGDDEIHGSGGNDDIRGGAGDDWIGGGRGDDTINGGIGVNDLYGGRGHDTFVMTAATDAHSDDWIGDFQFDIDKIDVSGWGATSFAQIRALLHTDVRGDAYLNAFYNGYDHYLTIDGVTALDLVKSDFIFADLGAQDIQGTHYRDTLFGSAFDDKIAAQAGDDLVLGDKGDDLINGGRGNDDLRGGSGMDTLIGSRGGDYLSGGGGADTFVFTNLKDSTVGNSDVITNFVSGTDHIDLSAVDWDSATPGTQSFDFIGQADFTAAGQLRYEHDNGQTVILGNTDADSAAEFRIVIDANVDLTGGDFIL